MYAGESFLSKKQCQRRLSLVGGKKQMNDLEKVVKCVCTCTTTILTSQCVGRQTKRKEELRTIFKTSSSDRKSYIHTADNAVQVTEYAQVFFNENSLRLLHNCNINVILPEKPDKGWLMVNSVKKYLQKELGSLFLLCSSVKSGSSAYLHGIRRTQDIDFMIDDRRLGPEVKNKMESLKEMMPWFDYKALLLHRSIVGLRNVCSRQDLQGQAF